MTHELLIILKDYLGNASEKAVMVSVVQIEGSSYRRAGVRMLIYESGKKVGAVSGGCVEKEIERQAVTVFSSDKPKMISYDGRYRLGCEGILYLLIEPFNPDKGQIHTLIHDINNRISFSIQTVYDLKISTDPLYGSTFVLPSKQIPFRQGLGKQVHSYTIFNDRIKPMFRLHIFGGEHDAIVLSRAALSMGWQVVVYVNVKEEKEKNDFPSEIEFVEIEVGHHDLKLEEDEAAILMTHSFTQDLNVLSGLTNQYPTYLGILGPQNRREKLLDALLERNTLVNPDFLDQIHAPAGLDLGGETPEEISTSILAEILMVKNRKSGNSLRDKVGNIHS